MWSSLKKIQGSFGTEEEKKTIFSQVNEKWKNLIDQQEQNYIEAEQQLKEYNIDEKKPADMQAIVDQHENNFQALKQSCQLEVTEIIDLSWYHHQSDVGMYFAEYITQKHKRHMEYLQRIQVNKLLESQARLAIKQLDQFDMAGKNYVKIEEELSKIITEYKDNFEKIRKSFQIDPPEMIEGSELPLVSTIDNFEILINKRYDNCLMYLKEIREEKLLEIQGMIVEEKKVLSAQWEKEALKSEIQNQVDILMNTLPEYSFINVEEFQDFYSQKREVVNNLSAAIQGKYRFNKDLGKKYPAYYEFFEQAILPFCSKMLVEFSEHMLQKQQEITLQQFPATDHGQSKNINNQTQANSRKFKQHDLSEPKEFIYPKTLEALELMYEKDKPVIDAIFADALKAIGKACREGSKYIEIKILFEKQEEQFMNFNKGFLRRYHPDKYARCGSAMESAAEEKFNAFKKLQVDYPTEVDKVIKEGGGDAKAAVRLEKEGMEEKSRQIERFRKEVMPTWDRKMNGLIEELGQRDAACFVEYRRDMKKHQEESVQREKVRMAQDEQEKKEREAKFEEEKKEFETKFEWVQKELEQEKKARLVQYEQKRKARDAQYESELKMIQEAFERTMQGKESHIEDEQTKENTTQMKMFYSDNPGTSSHFFPGQNSKQCVLNRKEKCDLKLDDISSEVVLDGMLPKNNCSSTT